MEYTNIQKNLGHSPRKLRLVADMVRKMKPEAAVETLKFTNRGAAADLAKAIKTTLANSGNRTDLYFKTLEVNEGLKMRRVHVGTAGRGRNRPYKKRLSHIRIVLSDEERQGSRVKGLGFSKKVQEKAEINNEDTNLTKVKNERSKRVAKSK